MAEAQLYPTREGSGGRVPMNSGEGGLRRGGLSGGPGEGDGDTPKLLLQKSTALSDSQAEKRGRGHRVEMRVCMQHKAAAVRHPEKVCERVFPLRGCTGKRCTVVPGAEGPVRLIVYGQAADRREIRDAVEPGGIKPVCAGQEPWWRVEETCCSRRSELWIRKRLKAEEEWMVA